MREIFAQFGWWALVDILLIAVAIYHVMLLIKGTRTAQMLTGVLILVIAFLASSILPLTTVNWMMHKFYSSIIIILIILFQEDIRTALSRIGKRSVKGNSDSYFSNHFVDEIAKAAMALAAKKIGALIIIERNIILTRYIDIGTLLDSKISKEILLAIFHPTSPIHDGAAIIQRGRIAASGCFLPLTRDENLDPNFGTRHRAAIGISQETDCVVVVVSEERGVVSIATEGQIETVGELQEFRKKLRGLLASNTGFLFIKNQRRPLKSNVGP